MSSRSEQIASQLRVFIKKKNLQVLPSMSILCREYGASFSTIVQAVKILKNEKLVLCRQGSKIHIVGQRIRDIKLSRCYIELEQRIVAGVLKRGTSIEKIAELAKKYTIARSYVIACLTELAQSNLVHKRGRKWIVGPSQDELLSTNDQKGIILIITKWEFDLRIFFNNQHILPFSRMLSNELNAAQMRLHFGFVKTIQLHSEAAGDGIKEIETFIRKNKEQYKGALVHLGYAASELKDLYKSLAPHEKPILYFDSANTFKKNNMPKHCPNFLCYSINEERAIDSVLEVLSEHGHKHIIYFNVLGGKVNWVKNRLILIKKRIKWLKLSIRVQEIIQSEQFWTGPGIDQSHQHAIRRKYELAGRISDAMKIKELSRHDHIIKLRDALINVTPSMAQLRGTEATAIVAPSDQYAFAYFQWLRMVGISLPEHMSLVSFGNIPEAVSYPVSTIDFGFENLGYLAAHHLIGDLPKAKRHVVKSEPAFLERGSIGKPRPGPLVF